MSCHVMCAINPWTAEQLLHAAKKAPAGEHQAEPRALAFEHFAAFSGRRSVVEQFPAFAGHRRSRAGPHSEQSSLPLKPTVLARQ